MSQLQLQLRGTPVVREPSLGQHMQTCGEEAEYGEREIIKQVSVYYSDELASAKYSQKENRLGGKWAGPIEPKIK